VKNALRIGRKVRSAALLSAGALALWGAGCATEPPPQELTLHCPAQGRTFTQQFTSAFVTRNAEGDTELVLADGPAVRAAEGGHADGPVRQIMHIQVKWHPKRDQKADHNSASNATVHWYVLGNTRENANDILEYAGTAFASVDDADDLSEWTIRNCSVSPVALRGELRDPIGCSQLHGSIHATESRGRVRELLTSVRTAVAAANAPAKVSVAKPESPSTDAR